MPELQIDPLEARCNDDRGCPGQWMDIQLMTDIATDSIFERSVSATHQTVAGEAILVDINTGSYYTLNETGTWVWENLDGQRTIGSLAQELAELSDIPDQVDMVEEDLIELLGQLARERLVVKTPVPPG